MPVCIARMIDDGSLRNRLGVVSREASGVTRVARKARRIEEVVETSPAFRACLAVSRKHERRAMKVPTADRRWPQKG